MKYNKQHHRCEGFTLLEILAAMVLLVVLVGIAVPALVGDNKAKAEVSAKNIVTALKQARSHAVTYTKETVLMFDLEQTKVDIKGTPLRAPKIAENLEIKLFTAQSEVIDTNIAGIRFFPNGTSTGGRVTVAIKNYRYAIDVDWFTGKVLMREVDKSDDEDNVGSRVVLSTKQQI